MEHETKFIMDMCGNHLGDRDVMREMIGLAANYGADYVKFQLFNSAVLSKDFPNYETAYAAYKIMELTAEDIIYIMDEAVDNSVKPMFTLFSEDRISFLKDSIEGVYDLKECAIKIASPDMSNAGLIQKARKGFPREVELFISTGMHSIQEVQEARSRMAAAANTHWLYCISKYPTKYEDVDFGAMQAYDGFSDHTLGIEAAKRAVEMKIPYIEKHFTLSRKLPGKDQKISIEPEELHDLVSHQKYLNSIDTYKNRWKGGAHNE